MGLRFRRRLRLDRRLRNLPGLWVNVSKTGGSVSLGRRGATLNVSKRSKMTTLGLPDSGLSHRSKRDPWAGHSRQLFASDGGSRTGQVALSTALAIAALGTIVAAIVLLGR
jgi:hypothetical protein